MAGMGDVPDEPWGTTRPCPHCAGTMIPIAYGMPDQELIDASEQGQAAIGGCVIPVDPIPQWRCTACGRDVAVAEAQPEA